jgi:RNA processing factor Prp31
MKRYVKLFEDFILEEDDPFAALGGDDESKAPKEDPLEKKKKEEEKAKKKEEEKHDDMVDKKEDKIEDILAKLPEVEAKLGDKIRDAIKQQDRVKIHNVANDITYMQQDYQENGNDKMVAKLIPLKDYIDDLDKSFTTDKMM